MHDLKADALTTVWNWLFQRLSTVPMNYGKVIQNKEVDLLHRT